MKSTLYVSALAALAALATLGARPNAILADTTPKVALEGCKGATLFNGFSYFKVTNVAFGHESANDTEDAYGVTLQLKNARPKDTMPVDIGVGQPRLFLADGTVLDMTTSSEILYGRTVTTVSMPQDAAGNGTFWYRTNGNTSQPSALRLVVQPNNSVYHTPFGYPVKNPSFNVKLNCTK